MIRSGLVEDPCDPTGDPCNSTGDPCGQVWPHLESLGPRLVILGILQFAVFTCCTKRAGTVFLQKTRGNYFPYRGSVCLLY